MNDIKVPMALAQRLTGWHSNMRDPIYAVSSSGLAKRTVPRDIFVSALANIESNIASGEKHHKEHLNELREIALEMKGVLGSTEGGELREAIVRGMARTLWALAWASEAEQQEDSPSLSGCDITHIAPETPEKARRACDDAITQFLETNDISLRDFYDKYKDKGLYRSSPFSPYDFGHEVIMSFTGYGGDFSFREYKKPYIEAYYYEYADEWVYE